MKVSMYGIEDIDLDIVLIRFFLFCSSFYII